MTDNLTVEEAISDSLITLVNNADGIDQRTFAAFLETAARAQADRFNGVPNRFATRARESSKDCVAPPEFA